MDVVAGLHLVVCYHAMGDRTKQKEAFQKLLQVPFDMENEDKYKDLEVRDVYTPGPPPSLPLYTSVRL